MTRGAWPAEDERVPQLGDEDQAAYEREAARSRIWSRWLAAPLRSEEERAAWWELMRWDFWHELKGEG